MNKLIFIFILITASTSLYSSERYDKYVNILKKVAEEYIIDHESQILYWKGEYLKNKVVIEIYSERSVLAPDDSISPPLPLCCVERKKRMEEREESYHHYPSVKMYTILWSDAYVENDFTTLPCYFFYVKDFLVLIYDTEQPSIDRNVIPKKFYYDSETDNGLVAIDDLDWTVSICKKTGKYMVYKKSTIYGVNPLIKELDQFSCHE